MNLTSFNERSAVSPKMSNLNADKLRLKEIAARRKAAEEGELPSMSSSSVTDKTSFNLGNSNDRVSDTNALDRIKLQMIAAKREAAEQNLPFDEAAYMVKLHNKMANKKFIPMSDYVKKVQMKPTKGNLTPPRKHELTVASSKDCNKTTITSATPASPDSVTVPFKQVGIFSQNMFTKNDQKKVNEAVVNKKTSAPARVVSESPVFPRAESTLNPVSYLPPPTQQSKNDLKKLKEMAERRQAAIAQEVAYETEALIEERQKRDVLKELVKMNSEIEADLVIEKDRAKIAAAALKREAEANNKPFDEKEYIRVKVDEKRRQKIRDRQNTIAKLEQTKLFV